MQSRSSRFTFSSLLVLSCAALAACSGQVVEIGAHDQGLALDGGGNVDGGPIDDGGLSGGELPKCEAPSGPVHEYTSIADTEARIAGTWLLCSGGIGSPADTAGIELAAGKAHFLQEVGGTLVSGPGADYERDVSFVDATSMNGPGSYQINLSTNAGTNMYFSRVSEDGKFLELNEGTSGKQARYVRVESKPACAISGAPHAYTSIADVQARIKGKWAVCSGGINSPADALGLELDGAADAWFLIDSSGTLVRGAGWDYERDVAIIDTTSMNGAGSYQINLSTGAGTNMYFSRVSEAGDVLELDEGTSGKKVVYRRIP
jgi:hypothetical protein